jgi:hypothetical protein
MLLAGHGLAVDLPRGWDGRIFRLDGGEATLHAASYPLPEADGEFGPLAVARMPYGGVFVALTGYRAGLAGAGLFRPKGIPRHLAPGDFSPRAVNGGRPGQLGLQRFCTERGRPLCVYVVVRGGDRRALVARANAVLATARLAGGTAL